jgi:hypothetical protein
LGVLPQRGPTDMPKKRKRADDESEPERRRSLQGAAWFMNFLERLDRAGDSVEERVLAGIGAWVDDYLRSPPWDEGYGGAIKSAARDILFATNSENRAQALSRFWGLLEWAARFVGRQDLSNQRAYIARSRLSTRRIELRKAVERAMANRHAKLKVTRGIGYAENIRPIVLKEMGLPEDAKWPAAHTVKTVVGEILDIDR